MGTAENLIVEFGRKNWKVGGKKLVKAKEMIVERGMPLLEWIHTQYYRKYRPSGG